MLKGQWNASRTPLIPLIKELDDVIDTDMLKNYRPVSNLVFISKLVERIVAIRLDKHMTSNNLNLSEQYGYKKGHSTEMLLVKVVNDLLIVRDKESATLLMLLDLSTAFDTVDQRKLLNILRYEIGLRGIALDWFRSFLCSRTLRVKINGAYSSTETLLYGVPQGSVLGPILFNIYTRSFYKKVQSLGVQVVGFADDHQLSLPVIPFFQVTTIHKVKQCFEVINLWMNFLRLNAEKTKILVICSPSTRSEIIVEGTFIDNKCVRFVTSAKNLGVVIDEELVFDDQVNKVTASCFNTIYKIS